MGRNKTVVLKLYSLKYKRYNLMRGQRKKGRSINKNVNIATKSGFISKK